MPLDRPSGNGELSTQVDSWAVVAVKLGRLAERRIQEKVTSLEVTAGQYIALADIARHPGISRAELARRLQMTPQAVAALLDHLSGKGLVVRTEPRPPIALDVTDAGRTRVLRADLGVHCLSRELLTRCFRPEAVAPIEREFRQILGRLRPP